MSSSPVICFGQQPCGIFPRRFLYAKVAAARRLQRTAGGRIVFFYHDSDHDPRETATLLRERRSGRVDQLNFAFANRLQKQFSPLYAKRVLADWKEKTVRQLPGYVAPALVDCFRQTGAANVADFCLEIYRRTGLLDGIEVLRSGDPAFRRRAAAVEDYFVDVTHEGEIVRARLGGPPGRRHLRLHKGGDAYVELPWREPDPAQVSPTRDTRWRWMQSVIGCTHYVLGAGERAYLDLAAAPGVEFVPRDEISRPDHAYVADDDAADDDAPPA